MASEKAMIAILSAKADDFIGKNNPVDEVLYGKGYNSKAEKNKKFNEALNSRKNNDIVITEKQIGEKIREHSKEYDLNPGNEDDRIQLLHIIDDIINNADEIVIGDDWRCQPGHPVFYIKGEDVVVVRQEDKHFVTILKGGITNARVAEARRRKV